MLVVSTIMTFLLRLLLLGEVGDATYVIGMNVAIALLYSLHSYRLRKVRDDHPSYLRLVKRSQLPSRNVLLLQNEHRDLRFAEIYEEARALGGIKRGLDKLFELCDEATAEYIDFANAGQQDSSECRELLQARQAEAQKLAQLLAKNERTRLQAGEAPSEPVIEGTLHREHHERMRKIQQRSREERAAIDLTARIEAERKMRELGGDPGLQEMMRGLQEDIDSRNPSDNPEA